MNREQGIENDEDFDVQHSLFLVRYSNCSLFDIRPIHVN